MLSKFNGTSTPKGSYRAKTPVGLSQATSVKSLVLEKNHITVDGDCVKNRIKNRK